MKNPVTLLETAFSYKFKDDSLAKLALTHCSADPVNNERLEFLGDAILGFTIAAQLYKLYPDASEGDLSRMRASLVNQQSLANIATGLKLGDLLILGPGELKSGGRQRESILSDAVEAVFGAVYLDGGLEACSKVILSVYGDMTVPTGEQDKRKDAKTRLQELLQSKSLALPVYEIITIDGEAHQQTFVVNCQIALLKKATKGVGSNRKIAEQQAAERALQALGL